MIVLRPADGMSCATIWLCPNRALSRRGLRRLIVVLAALTLTVAGLGAWQGNVYAPGFALVESAAVAWALRTSWRAGERGERITVDSRALSVLPLPGRPCRRFQTYWVRARLEPGHPRQRLLLSSHGQVMEIGAFLAEAERVAVYRRLSALLGEVQGTQI